MIAAVGNRGVSSRVCPRGFLCRGWCRLHFVTDTPGQSRKLSRDDIRKEKRMTTSRTYVKSEVVGSSDKSVSDAIESAIATASRSLRNLEWFEVVDVRGSIRDNKVANYQVTLKLGLRYEPKT
jgi:dodecin